MLARFYLTRNAVRKALIYLKLQPYIIVFTDDEFEHIHNVVKALQVDKLTMEVCVDTYSNLLTPDACCNEVHAEETESSEDCSWY